MITSAHHGYGRETQTDRFDWDRTHIPRLSFKPAPPLHLPRYILGLTRIIYALKPELNCEQPSRRSKATGRARCGAGGCTLHRAQHLQQTRFGPSTRRVHGGGPGALTEFSTAISCALRVKSKMPRSSCWYFGLLVAVASGMPCCTTYLSATWAVERPCAAAMALTSGTERADQCPPQSVPPSGEYAW